MESGLKKALGDSTGEDVYGIANLLAISVAAPEMAENGVNLLKNGVNLLKDGTNLLKNGVNLIKDVIGAAKDFIKESKLEIGFHEIAGIGGVRSPYINFIQKEKEDISSIKTIENIEKVDEGAADPITKSEYSSLRKRTPSNDIRKMVNPEGTKIDPVYGYATDVLEADHIVPMKEIVDMPGFSQLSREQQIEVLNLQDNFIGLGKSTNASKGAKNWTDWQGHSKLGEVPSDVRSNMLELESSARTALQKAIEERLKK